MAETAEHSRRRPAVRMRQDASREKEGVRDSRRFLHVASVRLEVVTRYMMRLRSAVSHCPAY